MKIENDKYYTPIAVANKCWDKVIELIGKDFIVVKEKNAVLILDMGIKYTMGFFIHLKMKMMQERHVLVLAGKC